MATNALRGRNLLAYINNKVIPLATSCKLSITTSTVDSTVKTDSEAWDQIDIITHGFTLTVDRLIAGDKVRGGKIVRGHFGVKNQPSPGVNNQIASGNTLSDFMFCEAGNTIQFNCTHGAYVYSTTDMEPAVNTGLKFEKNLTQPGIFTIKSTVPTLYTIFHKEGTFDGTDEYSILQPDSDTLIANLLSAGTFPFSIDIEGRTYTGTMKLTAQDIDGAIKENAKHNLTFTGDGALTKKP